ncbi:MAG: rubrerythrin family protein [Bacteroidales bacterium]|nr:rubrerythrin family protein [Bacteroidales bacterium]
MEKSIKGTRTEQNLLKAFAGESQAKNRYTFFAKVAKTEGYEQISALFLETASHEEMHAKRFFEFLEGGMVEITASYPAGKISTTVENLRAAAEGENEEWTLLYPEFADIAQGEGFTKIATLFRSIAKVEVEHEKRFLKLLSNVVTGRVFAREEKVKWFCRKCGFVYEGTKALANCPACAHPRAHFELLVENY